MHKSKENSKNKSEESNKVTKTHKFYMIKENKYNKRRFVFFESFERDYTQGLEKLTSEERKDREIMKNKILENILYGFIIDHSLKSDKEFFVDLIQVKPEAFMFASDKLQYDIPYLIELLRINSKVFVEFDEKISFDKKTITEFMQDGFITLNDIPMEMMSDEDFIMKLLEIDVSQIQLLENDINNDPNFLMRYVVKLPEIIKYTYCDMTDRQLVESLIKSNPHVINYLNKDQLKLYHDLIINEIRLDGTIVDLFTGFTHSQMREFVFESINENTEYLSQAVYDFLHDKEILIKALEKDYTLEQYLNNHTLFDKDVIRILEKNAVKKFYFDKLNTNYATYYYFPKQIKKDKDVLDFYNLLKDKYT